MDIGQRFELPAIISKSSTLENGERIYHSRDEAEMALLGRNQILKVFNSNRRGICLARTS